MRYSPLKLAPLALSLLVAVIIVGLGALSFQRKLQSFQTLDFQAVSANGIWIVVEVDPGQQYLEAGDRILLIDGAQIPNTETLRSALHEHPESVLLVQRGEDLSEITYPRPPFRSDVPYLLAALIGVLYLLVGLITLVKNQSRTGLMFYTWSLLYASVFLMTSEALQPDLVDKLLLGIEDFSRALLPALTVHLFLVLPESPKRDSLARKAVPFFYLPAILLVLLRADLNFAGGRWILQSSNEEAMIAAFTALERFSLALLAAYSLIAAILLAYRVLGNPHWRERRQFQWIALGTAAGYLPFLGFLLARQLFSENLAVAGWLHSAWTQSLVLLPLALVPLTFAWAILQYKLWDIDVILRDTVSYSMTTLIGIFGFILINQAVTRSVPEDFNLARNVVSFGAGLLIAAMVAPAHRRISSVLERFQYRETFQRRAKARRFGRGLLQERDLSRLCNEVLESLQDSLELERVALYLSDDSDPDRLIAFPGSGGAPASESKVPKTLSTDELGNEVWQGDVYPISPISVPSGEPVPMQRLFQEGFRYAFPLKTQEGKIGVALMGYKLGSRPLNSEDQELARNLLNQTALAFENAGLVRELSQQLMEVESLQRYNAEIIESSPAGIVVLDEVDRIVSANPAFARLVGLERGALVSRPVEEALPIRPLPGDEDGPLEVSYCDLGGEEHYLQISAARLLSASRDQPLRIFIVHDVSERVAMENALREQDRLAALGMLAAGVAHEVNTPLTGISSYAQMLLEDTPESDPRRSLLHKVEQQTFRASRIVNNLLEFARNRSGDFHAISVERLLQETLDLLKERLSKKGIRAVWTSRAPEATVRGNDGELQQVLTNLILNAVDAMTGTGDATLGGELRVGVLEASGRIRVTIEDTGQGIPAERLEKIFQPFFSTKLNRGGTGLGLSISYDIVRRHSGDLRVVSHPGEGTSFLIDLPSATSSADAADC